MPKAFFIKILQAVYINRIFYTIHLVKVWSNIPDSRWRQHILSNAKIIVCCEITIWIAYHVTISIFSCKKVSLQLGFELNTSWLHCRRSTNWAIKELSILISNGEWYCAFDDVPKYALMFFGKIESNLHEEWKLRGLYTKILSPRFTVILDFFSVLVYYILYQTVV